MRGATVRPDGVMFSVWGPRAGALELAFRDERLPMRGSEDGVFELLVPAARAGDDYAFVLDQFDISS